MHLSPSTSAMRHIPATSTLDAVTSVQHRGSETFNVMTSGDPDCELLLFPENGIPIEQELPVDATQYERQFYGMHPEEQLAIRRWTAAGEEAEKFSDYELPLHRQGIFEMNYDLNGALAAGRCLDAEQQDMCEQLSSALQQLPPLHGEYLRVAEYTRQDAMPWGRAIQVGDTVTNFPCFMSVSADATYAAQTANGTFIKDCDVLVTYKIDNATTAIPLWRGTASLADELEFLFPRESCFIVKGISTARRTMEIEGRPTARVGILLQQVPVDTRAKNLYTGTPVDIQTQTEQRPVQRTSREATRQRQGHLSNMQTVNYVTEMKYDLPAAERFRPLGSAELASKQASLQLQREEFRPEQFALPSTALQAIRHLAVSGSKNPTAVAAAVMERQCGGMHIGLRLAVLMSTYPRAAAAPLTAYLELVNALHASGHLTSEEVQSLLLPESQRERHLPISAAVASHWQSRVAQPFVSTLANATPESGKEKVISRLRLEQADQHHPQIRMQYSADFYKQIKRGMENLPAAGQDTPARRLLAGHGLIPPERELGRMVKKLPVAALTTGSPGLTLSEIAANSDEVMPAVLRQEAKKQKQDAELEKARATYQANRQATEHAREAKKSSPVAAMVAGLSSHLHAQGAALRAQKPQSIAQWEQARATRRRLDEQDRQGRDRAQPSALTVLMRAGQAAGLARSGTDALRNAAPPYAIQQSAEGLAIGKASTQALAAHSDHAASQSQNTLVPRSGSNAMVQLPSNTKYSRSTGEFSVPVKAIIHHETVSGSLSGQIDSGVVVHIPAPERSNVAIPGTSADRQPAQREIPTVVGIDNTSHTIAISLQQGQQQLGIGALWQNVVNRELHFNDQSGETRITVSPPKAPVGPKQ